MNANPEPKPCDTCEYDTKWGLTRCSLCGAQLAPGREEADLAAGMYFGIRHLAESLGGAICGKTSQGDLYFHLDRTVHGAVDVFMGANWLALDYRGGISRYLTDMVGSGCRGPQYAMLDVVTQSWRSELEWWSQQTGEIKRNVTTAEQHRLWLDLPLYLAGFNEVKGTITVRKFVPGDWTGHVRSELVRCPPGVVQAR